MHGMSDIKKGFEDWGVVFAIYKLVLFENTVMRIMFELNGSSGRKRKDNAEFLMVELKGSSGRKRKDNAEFLMFELKGSNGRKRKDNAEFRNLYCLSGSRVSKNSGRWVRNVACMGVKGVLKRFLIGKREGKSPFRRPVCLRDDKLKWILRNYIRVYFYYLCFRRALNETP